MVDPLEVVDLIVRALIGFVAVLMLTPHQAGENGQGAPVSGVLAALQTAVLADISQVRADIAQSQRERGGSLLRNI
ncbi:MAG TPA: hypothetical protein VL026_08005 [Rhizomicrobium sp.]|nr:hypothetical protein [Rhizomicrobium sp.]